VSKIAWRSAWFFGYTGCLATGKTWNLPGNLMTWGKKGKLTGISQKEGKSGISIQIFFKKSAFFAFSFFSKEKTLKK